MTDAAPELVHSRLARWAHERGAQVAIRNGHHSLTFAELHHAVQAHASTLTRSHAGATVLLNSALPLHQRLVAFLGTVASGRCAAVSAPTWPPSVLQAVQANLERDARNSVNTAITEPTPTTAFYIGFTSGSTGLPKGFRRHHQSWTESFRLCTHTFGEAASSCILAPGSDAHSLFLFGMLLGLWTGAGVVVQEQFSAAVTLDTLRGGQTPCLVAVPSQLLMLLELAQHRQPRPIEGVRLILISGAQWTRSRTPELQSLFPQARIIEFYGASETSFIAWTEAHADLPDNVVGRPFEGVEVDVRGARADQPDGLIYVRSPLLFMDYVGPCNDSTAALRDGDWVSVRDVGHVDAQGRLCVAGRESRMLITLAKKLFPEEVEAVLEAHPAVAHASVHGVPDPVRGMRVVAVLHLAGTALASASANATTLTQWCHAQLEAYKAPRHYWLCSDWPFTASGKTDHAALARLLRLLAQAPTSLTAHPTTTPCLVPLHS